MTLAVNDRMRSAVEAGAGHGGSAPAALVSLAGYLEGKPIDSLRGPLGLTHSAAVRVVDCEPPSRRGRATAARLRRR